MERGSAQHGPMMDDQLKQEVENELRGGGPSRAEDWRDPEMPDSEEIEELGLTGQRRSDPSAG